MVTQSQLPFSPETGLVEYQPILICPEWDYLNNATSDLLNGIHAAIIVRKNSIIEPLYEKLLSDNLRIAETTNFDKIPLTVEQLSRATEKERETLHLDRFQSSKTNKGTFPYTLTAIEITQGSGLLLAGLATSKVKGYTDAEYSDRRRQLIASKNIIRQKTLTPNPGHNQILPVAHRGVLENKIGAVVLMEGDQLLIAQGGNGCLLPAWHAILTPPNVRRRSTSRHMELDRRDHDNTPNPITLDRRSVA
jgi:hypothetical protein